MFIDFSLYRPIIRPVDTSVESITCLSEMRCVPQHIICDMNPEEQRSADDLEVRVQNRFQAPFGPRRKNCLNGSRVRIRIRLSLEVLLNECPLAEGR